MKLKVMTFNLRVRAKSDGENIFDLRRPYILDAIRNESPDVIGFQEANDDMIDFLQENLPEYYFLGHGREAGYRGEAPAIAYRWKKLALRNFAEEMLSLTPDTVGSLVEGINQSKCPRAYSVAELVLKESGKIFLVGNIHTDHIDQNVIFAECVMFMQAIGRRNLPFILTGDYNATPETLAVQMILASRDRLGTVDATSEITHSFHGYGKYTEGYKIDYVFTSLPTNPAESYAVPQPTPHFYSDHHALCAFVEV
ncbi:MAG: endonuclease/exonuclease/phosphatase family protein [Clostridia bacterium]|nr:endonuclease/exonuclease/phosphatase family protein [Clostridia bacterium]